MSDEIRLIWNGPFRFKEFFGNEDLAAGYRCPGVYVWIEQTDQGNRLYYVGKAGGSPSLYTRQVQHYAHLIGGLYSIPARFRKCGEDWAPKRTDPSVYAVLTDPAKFHQLVDDAFVCADAYAIYMAKLKTSVEAKVCERQLLYDLKPVGTRWGCGSPPGEATSIVHVNAAWATVEMRRELEHRAVQFVEA